MLWQQIQLTVKVTGRHGNTDLLVHTNLIHRLLLVMKFGHSPWWKKKILFIVLWWFSHKLRHARPCLEKMGETREHRLIVEHKSCSSFNGASHKFRHASSREDDLGGRSELDRDTVHTVALIGGCLEAFSLEHMAQMSATGCTCDLYPPTIRIRLKQWNKWSAYISNYN